MLDELNEDEWKHFAQREYARQLIAAGEDLLLIGGPRSGKKTFLRRLQLQSQINIECSIINTLGGVQQEFFRQLQRALPNVGQKAKLRSFESAELALDDGVSDLRVTAIFRNVNCFLAASQTDFSAFFARYFSFALSVAHRGLHLQSILLAQSDIPLTIPRCRLPYPDTESLRGFVARKVASITAEYAKSAVKRDGDAVHARCEREIFARFQEIVTRVHSFVILFRDFDAIELVARNLISMLRKDYLRVANENFQLKHQYLFENCQSLFYYSPRMLYARPSALLEVVSTREADMPMEESLQCAQAMAFDHRSAVAKNLPRVAKYVLLALYICSAYKVSSHLSLVGNIKRSAKRPKESLNKLENGYKKRVSQWRVCHLAEMLANTPHSAPLLEIGRMGYSMEFHFCFDLLERVGFVVRAARGLFDSHYRLVCETKLIEKVQQDLGLMGQFIVD